MPSRASPGLTGSRVQTASFPIHTPWSLAPISAPHIQAGLLRMTAWVCSTWGIWMYVHCRQNKCLHVKTSPHLLQLFGRTLQHDFAMKDQKCFVDYEIWPDYPSAQGLRRQRLNFHVWVNFSFKPSQFSMTIHISTKGKSTSSCYT